MTQDMSHDHTHASKPPGLAKPETSLVAIEEEAQVPEYDEADFLLNDRERDEAFEECKAKSGQVPNNPSATFTNAENVYFDYFEENDEFGNECGQTTSTPPGFATTPVSVESSSKKRAPSKPPAKPAMNYAKIVQQSRAPDNQPIMSRPPSQDNQRIMSRPPSQGTINASNPPGFLNAPATNEAPSTNQTQRTGSQNSASQAEQSNYGSLASSTTEKPPLTQETQAIESNELPPRLPQSEAGISKKRGATSKFSTWLAEIIGEKDCEAQMLFDEVSNLANEMEDLENEYNRKMHILRAKFNTSNAKLEAKKAQYISLLQNCVSF
jgi:hypothetical protein